MESQNRHWLSTGVGPAVLPPSLHPCESHFPLTNTTRELPLSLLRMHRVIAPSLPPLSSSSSFTPLTGLPICILFFSPPCSRCVVPRCAMRCDPTVFAFLLSPSRDQILYQLSIATHTRNRSQLRARLPACLLACLKVSDTANVQWGCFCNVDEV